MPHIESSASSIHGGKDLRELPRYSMRDAAAYLRISRSTLQTWVTGRSYDRQDGQARSRPILKRPDPKDLRLSFTNLVEAWVLRALRQTYALKMSRVRTAISHAEKQYGVERLLLSEQLRAAPGQVFLDRYVELVELGSGGQAAMREILAAYLDRVVYERGVAARLYPLAHVGSAAAPRVVLIDPRYAFGRPVVESKGIRTAVIGERFEVGESISDLCADYGLEPAEVEEAIRYESRSERAA